MDKKERAEYDRGFKEEKMGTYYRNISDLGEICHIFKTGNIPVTFFPSNEDSDIPTGWFSFWFDSPVRLTDPILFAEAIFTPLSIRSRMTAKRFYEDFCLNGPRTVTMELPEFVAAKPVEIRVIKKSSLCKNKIPWHDCDILEVFDWDENVADRFKQWFSDLQTFDWFDDLERFDQVAKLIV